MPRISKKKSKTVDSDDDESVVSQRVVSKKKATPTRRSTRRATQRKVYRDASDSEDSYERPVKKAKNTKNTKTKKTTAHQPKRSANSDTDATADSSSDEGTSIASYNRKAVRKESTKPVARKRARLGKKDIVGNDAIVSPPPPMEEVGDWRDLTALDY